MRKSFYNTLVALIIITLFVSFRFSKLNYERLKGLRTVKESSTIINKDIGDEIFTNIYKLKVINVEEVQSISSYYGSKAEAAVDCKFIVIALQLTNTTSLTLNFSPDLTLIDNKNREFNSYHNTVGNINNYIDNRELLPGVTETGYLIYELPLDSMSYNICLNNSEKNELNIVKLK